MCHHHYHLHHVHATLYGYIYMDSNLKYIFAKIYKQVWQTPVKHAPWAGFFGWQIVGYG